MYRPDPGPPVQMAASVLSKGARQQQVLNPFVLKLKSPLMQDCADWKSELGRALAKKVKLAKEFAIACDPDYRIVFQ